MLESQLKQDVMKALRKIPGLWCAGNTVGTVWARHRQYTVGLGLGTPDIVGCYKGLFFGIELKRPKIKGQHQAGVLEDHQARCHETMRSAGAYIVVCSSVDEAVTAVLAAYPGTPEALGGRQSYDSPLLCEHANEVPSRCSCPPHCYCKSHTCGLA